MATAPQLPARPRRLEDTPSPRGLSALGEMVRRHDHDRYLTSLFAPPDRREALFAVHALNLEIARIRASVSEPLLGQIRFQWWRDRVAEAFAGRPARHQVLGPLAEAAARYGLDRAQVDRLLDAREADLDDEPFDDVEAMRRYAVETGAPPVRLAIQVLGAKGRAAAYAAERVGAAWAMIGLLRAVPFHARERRILLPLPLTRRFAVDRGDLLELRPQAALADLVREVAREAAGLLAEARDLAPRVERAARPALLLARLADSHLAVLRRSGWNVFDARVVTGGPGRSLALAWTRLRGRY